MRDTIFYVQLTIIILVAIAVYFFITRFKNGLNDWWNNLWFNQSQSPGDATNPAATGDYAIDSDLNPNPVVPYNPYGSGL